MLKTMSCINIVQDCGICFFQQGCNEQGCNKVGLCNFPQSHPYQCRRPATKSQVCESTGVVVAPYTDFPQLLSVLLRMLGEGGDMAVKRDLLRLLGILGALDPHQHKARLHILYAQV